MSLIWILLGILCIIAIWQKRQREKQIQTFFTTAKLGQYTSPSIYNHFYLFSMGRVMDPDDTLPGYFKWKEQILVPVRDQGKCASCWAFAVSDCLADRLSIETGGVVKKNLSVQELMSCFNSSVFHCKRGGIPELTYKYVIAQGLHTEEAYPYKQFKRREIPPCAVKSPWYNYVFPSWNKHERDKEKVFGMAGSDRSLCYPISTLVGGTTEFKEKHKQNITNMKTEIYLHGPIVGTMFVRKDLYKYDGKTVYRSSPTSPVMGGHAIEIFGWCDAGNNTKEPGFEKSYWICRNSWGVKWPKRLPYGLMYIEMGINESGIESRASSVRPMLNSTTASYHKKAIRNKLCYKNYQDYATDPNRVNFIAQDTKKEQLM